MRFFVFLGLALAVSSPAYAWGPVGHRVTGAIADEHLSGVARAHVQILLGQEDLAEASTWPDEMKSDPANFWQKTANPWHYVTVAGDDYQATDMVKEGDAMSALSRFSATLRNPQASMDDKRIALRFIVHIIGDLHQPLHAGGHSAPHGGDRGGNDAKVTWFGRQTNLHSLWDSALIEHRALSYSELSAWLARSITPQQVIEWSASSPALWVQESIALRKTIYPTDPNLSWDYAYQHRTALDDRLKRAGIRIAAYLNHIFEQPIGEKPARK